MAESESTYFRAIRELCEEQQDGHGNDCDTIWPSQVLALLDQQDDALAGCLSAAIEAQRALRTTKEKLAKIKEICGDYVDYDTQVLHDILNVIEGHDV